jgi:hypothetical protein
VLYSRQVDQASPAYKRLAGISGEAASALQQLEGFIRRLALVKLDPALADRDREFAQQVRDAVRRASGRPADGPAGAGSLGGEYFGWVTRQLARVITLAGLPRWDRNCASSAPS